MDIYGLIGKSLSHSKSPEYFNNRFKEEGIDAEYRLFEIDNAEKLETLIKNTPNLKGLNITIPYKRSINHLVDISSPETKLTGSVNTLKISRQEDKRLIEGFNTDIIGFKNSIEPYIKKQPNIRALILGTGGAAHTASFVLKSLNVPHYFVSRNPLKGEELGYNKLTKDIFDEYRLIVNCTPLGMFPNIESSPDLVFEYINSENICFDCVYNPEETEFLKTAKMNGAKTISGKQMFEIQANEAWKIWIG